MMQNYISPLALISSLNNSIVLNLSVLKRVTFGFLLFCCWQTFSHTTKSVFSENKVSIEVDHSSTAVVTPTTGPTHDKYVVGYFAQWAIYARDFNVSDIEAEHLTHLMYAFYDVKFEEDDSGTVSLTTLDDWADFGHTEDPGVLYGSNPKGNFGALKILKMENPHLNILMSIGGWTRSIDIPAIANDPVKTDMLVQQMVNLMTRFPFIDGFDVDWEFPITGGISAAESSFGDQPHYDNDHTNLVLLLKAMREGFDEAFPANRKWVTMAGGNNVGNLLSTHVGPGTESLHGATENLADYADFITFFGYDFGGNWFEKTSYNAPLYRSYNLEDPLIRRRAEVGPEAYDETQLIDKNRDGIDDLYDAINEAKGISTDKVPQQALDDLITLYLDYLEIPKEKLILGVPFYGRLFDNVAHGEVETGLPGLFRYAPRRTGVRCTNGLDGFGRSSPQGSWDDPNDRTFFGGECGFSGSIGFSDLSQGVASNPHHLLDINDYSKLSQAAMDEGWVRHWDDTAKVPYLYNENTQQFISYDDEESINIKVNYALQRDLGGVMIWELSEDSRHELERDATTRVPKYTFDNAAALLNQIEESLNSIQVTLTLNFEDQTGAPIEGLLVELTNRNGTPITSLTTTATGQAVFPNLEGYRDYNFSYTKEDFAFLPPNKALAAQLVSSDKSFTIVGSNNLIAFEGTTTLEGTAGSANVQLLNAQDEVVLETQSGSDGSFRLENVVGGLDYSLTATQEFYTFNSPNYTAPTTDVLDIDLTGTRDRYTLSGKILDAEGGTVSQVTVYLSGDATDAQTTNDTCVFRFENLEAGRDYTLTPQHDELSFLPQTKNYNTLRQDQSVDFVLNNGFFFGTAKDGTTPIEGVTVPTPTTTDNCAGVVAGTTTFPENFHLTGVYDIIWIFNDNNGNSVASTQSIEVVDNTPPDVPTLEPVEVSCGESVSSPSLIDSCSNEEIVARTDDPTSFAREGNYTIRWIFTDANGNQATTTQEVEVAPFDDLILPELPLLSDSCTIIVPRPIATDGCSGAEVLGETEDTLVYTEIGEYTVNWVFTDRFGKETRATQRVQLNADREVDDEIEACDSYTWIDGVTYTEDNNTARFIEEDAEGCEIIHYLKLTINKVDPTIMRIDNTLIANQEGARYQWIDCDNDNQPIVGETNREFTPSRKGSYAVRVTTVDECTEISECYAFDIEVSIAEGDITIFPVPPTEGIINIVMSEPLTFTKVELLSIDNKLILEETFSSPVSSASISMPSLATGVYFVRLITPDGTLYIKQILIP